MTALSSRDGQNFIPNEDRKPGFVGIYIGEDTDRIHHGALVGMDAAEVDSNYAMFSTPQSDSPVRLRTSLVVPSIQILDGNGNDLEKFQNRAPVRILYPKFFIPEHATSDALGDNVGYVICVNKANNTVCVDYKTRGGYRQHAWMPRNAVELNYRLLEWKRFFRVPEKGFVQITQQLINFKRGEIVQIKYVSVNDSTGDLYYHCVPAYKSTAATVKITPFDCVPVTHKTIEDCYFAGGVKCGELVEFDNGSRYGFITAFETGFDGTEQYVCARIDELGQDGELLDNARRNLCGVAPIDDAMRDVLLSKHDAPSEEKQPSTPAERYATLVDTYRQTAEDFRERVACYNKTLTVTTAHCSPVFTLSVDFSNPPVLIKEYPMLKLETVHYLNGVDLALMSSQKVNELLCKESQRIKDLEDAPIKTKAYRKSIAEQRKNLERIIEFIDAQTAPSDDE